MGRLFFEGLWKQLFCSNYVQFNELIFVDHYYCAFHTSRLKHLFLVEAEVECIEFRGDLWKK